ncbi:Fanconi anemia core complex-associated protein 100 [Aulostomus maculatus]
MEGRCVVDTLAQFGFSAVSFAVRIESCCGTDVFVCTGSEEVYFFSPPERKLAAVLQFPSAVSDLVVCPDMQLLFVACRSGVYSVSLSFLQSRVQSSMVDASFSPAHLQISQECLVIEDEGVSSLLLVGSVLLRLSLRDMSWLLTAYQVSKQSSSCEMLRSFSLLLVSDAEFVSTELRRGRRPVLVCVHSGDSSFTSSITDRHVHLECVLFKLLFGVDAALAKSPVILCGLPDGRLCFISLHSPGSQLRVLNSLEQPVIFIGATAVMETCPRRAKCLVAVGEQGRVVLITTEEGEGVRASFTEGCVVGPVACACVDERCLYYSTGSDLLALDLLLGPLGTAEEARDVEASSRTALQSPTSLNVCRLVALAQQPCSTAGGVELLGLSCRGQLQRISIPVGGENAGASKLPSTHVGSSARDLLSAIGDVCERASVLKTTIKSKNQILKHLNQVLNITFLLIPCTDGKDPPPIQGKTIRCHARTKWIRLLQKDSLNLNVFLNNGSSYILEQGWTLNVTVLPLCFSLRGESCSTNFSFPIRNLHPGEELEVSLPLAAAGDTSFPITVRCSLIFSLSSLLGEEAAAGFQSSCISLPLNTLTVDWLHGLQVISPAHNNVTVQSHHITTPFQDFLNSRRTRCSTRGDGENESALKPEQEQYHAAVKVATDLLTNTLLLETSEGPKLPHQNICLSLLEWLLSEGPGGVKMEHQGEDIAFNNSAVQARAPDGYILKLSAKEVAVQHIGEEGQSLATVEVRVQSSSMAAVCGLHHAILRRVQTLLQTAPVKDASTQSMQTLCLRQTLQRAEQMLQQIQRSRISGAFGEGVSTRQTAQSLLSVYRGLREHPLLIA